MLKQIFLVSVSDGRDIVLHREQYICMQPAQATEGQRRIKVS